MGNRVSNLWCKKTNLDKELNENTKSKREPKRRFKQRRLSLNCMTRENSAKSTQESVLVHKPSSSLPRNSKLSTPERNFAAIAQNQTETKVFKVEEKPKESPTTNENLIKESISNSSPLTASPKSVANKPLDSHDQKPVCFTNSLHNTNSNSFGVVNLEKPPLNSFSPISSSLSSPSTCSPTSSPAITIDVLDSPIRVLATTKTQDILTSEKLTCTTSSISSLKTATMKFNADSTTVKVIF